MRSNNRKFLYESMFLISGILFLALNIFPLFFTNDWDRSYIIQFWAEKFGTSNTIFLAVCSLIVVIVSIPFITWLLKTQESLIIKKMNAALYSSKVFWSCIVIASIGVLVQIIFCFSQDIWADESFSLALIKHSYSEVISLTAADVHPPLYYFILKFFVDSTRIILTDLPAVYFAKIVSTIPYILLLLVCATKIRKEWNNYVAAMFAICLVGMQNLIMYGVEIRMYNWGMLFVTLAFLYANDIITKKRKKDWILFVLFSLLAAYTHYFACIAAGISYLMLFVWFYVNDKKQIKNWLIAVIITVIGYFPWLIIFIQQAQKVSDDYWIPEIAFTTIIGYARFMFEMPLLAIIAIIIIVCLIIDLHHTKFRNWTSAYSFSGILIPIGTTLFGIIVSVIIRPVFISRYMIPGLASLWLGLFIAIDSLNKEKLKVVTSFLMISFCLYNIAYFSYSENLYRIKSNNTINFLNSQKNAVYFSDNSHINMTLAEMTETKCYIWKKEVSLLETQVFENMGSLHSTGDIIQLLKEGKAVYFAEYSNNRSVGEILHGSNLNYMNMGKYRAEFPIEIYKITETDK
ncbi:hypothetical protein [uncultured Ilyobacter sp.]|uniref:glycosyltransferase family 39 protein n=1 Tax=uncultured Ilyobacter sp. TaxID=544433 RepID=UPI002AA72794|nr:hypothetical protein [uncultured Ilyobacter sp.]